MHVVDDRSPADQKHILEILFLDSTAAGQKNQDDDVLAFFVGKFVFNETH